MSIADRYHVEYEGDTGTNVYGPTGIIKMDSIADKAKELNRAYAEGHVDAVKAIEAERMARMAAKPIVEMSPPAHILFGQQKANLEQQLLNPNFTETHKDAIRDQIAQLEIHIENAAPKTDV